MSIYYNKNKKQMTNFAKGDDKVFGIYIMTIIATYVRLMCILIKEVYAWKLSDDVINTNDYIITNEQKIIQSIVKVK